MEIDDIEMKVDLPQQIGGKKFVKKGYHTVAPPADADRQPVGMRWYAEEHPNDLPEINPLPAFKIWSEQK